MNHSMKCLLVATALGLSGIHTNAAPVTDLASGATGRIEFQSMNPPDRWQYARLNMQNTPQQVVWGDLLMPKSASGKVPALVLSHGSSGISPAAYDVWAAKMNDAGVAIFIIDSFKPRGVEQTATDQSKVTFPAQTADALNALRLLATHPQIDATRIFHIGMSRGGGVAFDTAWPTWQRPVDTNGARFAGHIALYPSGCDVRFRTDDREKATARIFLGLTAIDGEDWQNGSNCVKYAEDLAKKGNIITVKEYKGTYHGFDTNNKYVSHAAVVSSKACDMEIYMTTVQGGGLGNNGFDFKANKALTTHAEFFQAQKQSCGELVRARTGGDSGAQREVVADVLSFLKGLK
jgi:dienelactone hydrolase